MAYTSRPTSMLPTGPSATSHRQPNNLNTQQQSSALAARIATKKAELENLHQLRDMSNALAVQMESLQANLETLKDGTEAVACVLANWNNVLHAITMASSRLNTTEDGLNPDTKGSSPGAVALPSTLVRIPAAHQEDPDCR